MSAMSPSKLVLVRVKSGHFSLSSGVPGSMNVVLDVLVFFVQSVDAFDNVRTDLAKDVS